MDNNEFAEEYKNIIIDGVISNYEISNVGIVRNKTNGYLMKPILNNNGYYRVGLYHNKIQKIYTLHCLIAIYFIPNPENKPFIDHINNVKTDNRLENLRWCNQSENSMNRKISSNNKTGYKGVSFDKLNNKWCAHIMINRKYKKLGRFASIEDAINARKEASTKYFGEFLNDCEKEI
jgi:hypothetical protein